MRLAPPEDGSAEAEVVSEELESLVVVAAPVVLATRPPLDERVGVALEKVVLREMLMPVPDALAGAVPVI